MGNFESSFGSDKWDDDLIRLYLTQMGAIPMLTRVQEMKIFVSGVKQLFNVLSEIESVRADALKIFKVTVQRLENSIAEIDSELLKPRGLDLGDVSYGETEVRHIEGSLSDLQKQLMDLRRELQEMK